MVRLRSSLPVVMASLVGAGLYGASRLSLLVPHGKILVWWGIGVITVAAVAAAGFLLTRAPSSPPAASGIQPGSENEPAEAAPAPAVRQLRLTEPPILLATGAFLFLLMAESPFGRWSLVVLTMLLIAVYFEGLRRVADKDNPVSAVDLAQLAHVLDLAAVFLVMAFVFGIQAFYHVPAPVMALIVAVIWAFVTAENLSRSGIRVKVSVRPLVAVALFGAEAYAALALLPVSYLVNAAVSVILLAVSIQIIRLVLSGEAESARMRRDLAASVGLAALLLVTARWS